MVPEVEKEKTKREKLLEKKRRLKEMFDSEYDGKDDGDHFDTLKAELSQQAQVTIASTRVQKVPIKDWFTTLSRCTVFTLY